MEPVPSKRNHTAIPISLKKEICYYYANNPTATHAKVQIYINEKHGYNIAKNTVSDILRETKKWQEYQESSSSRIRPGQNPLLEKAIYEWYVKLSTTDTFIKDEMIIEKAKSLSSLYNIDKDFKFSLGWLSRFKERFNLPCKRNRKSLKDSKDSKDINPLNWSLLDFSHNLSSSKVEYENISINKNVFYFQTFSLYYNFMPIKVYSHLPSSDINKWKEIVTIGVFIGTDGTKNSKPIVISSKRLVESKHYVEHYTNGEGIIDLSILEEILSNFDNRLAAENKNAIINISEKYSGLKNSNKFSYLTLEYINYNIQSKITKFIGDIIYYFKARYRSNLLKHYIISLNDIKKIALPEYNEVLGYIFDSWNIINSMSISQSYNFTQLKNQNSNINEILVDCEKLTAELTYLIETLEVPIPKLTPIEYIDIESKEESQLTRVNKGKHPEASDLIQESSEKVTAFEAIQCAKILISFLEANDGFNDKPLQVVRRVFSKVQDFCVLKINENQITTGSANI